MTKTLKRWFVTILIVGTMACASLFPKAPHMGNMVVTLEAQTLPINKTLGWNAQANTDSFIVKLDGTQIGTPTGITQAVTITTLGSHTFSVAAVNIWGQSSPTTLTVNVISPNAPAGLNIQ